MTPTTLFAAAFLTPTFLTTFSFFAATTFFSLIAATFFTDDLPTTFFATAFFAGTTFGLTMLLALTTSLDLVEIA